MKVLSLKLKDEVFSEAEKLIEKSMSPATPTSTRR